MKTEQIIKTLRDYNDWRRARDKWEHSIESFFDTTTTHEIGLTIDAAIERLQTLEKERDEARAYIEKLMDGHLFVRASWEMMQYQSKMNDTEWLQEVGKKAVKMAIMETDEYDRT